MSENQIQIVASTDGTKIAGRVQGQGEPLVLVHGGLGDGDAPWLFMLPFLVEQFTCYLMSTRGRGRSGDNADHSRERQLTSPPSCRASTSRCGYSVTQAGRSGHGRCCACRRSRKRRCALRVTVAGGGTPHHQRSVRASQCGGQQGEVVRSGANHNERDHRPPPLRAGALRSAGGGRSGPRHPSGGPSGIPGGEPSA